MCEKKSSKKKSVEKNLTLKSKHEDEKDGD